MLAIAASRSAMSMHLRRPGALLVMGAQGTSGIELMVYGSNTHHVVRAATCPVLTVRA